VIGLATANPARPDEMLVPIADATSTPHGVADSRTAASATGLGTGTIGLREDASGRATSYYWVGGVSKKAWSTAFAFARPD
jgi:hypothetical protein